MYWDKEGRECTGNTVKQAIEAAKSNGIRHIVVASNTGETARLFVDCGLDVTCVTHVYGFRAPGENEMDMNVRRELENKGMKVLTTAHALSGVERAFSNKFGGTYPAEIMANSLRMLGQGVKVCVEIATMAMDSGCIPHGEKVVAVGGTGRGADTAVIIRPSYSKDIFNTRIEEIVCKPR